MNKKTETKLSGFMTKILRHSPLDYGVVLDDKGFTPLNELLAAINEQEYWKDVTLQDLKNVVSNCEKQRYELEGHLIRARYGHSFIKLGYQEKQPPEKLIHGTATKFLDNILKDGILSMGRKYVHLSETNAFASLTGKRHGKLVLLEVDSQKAFQEGVKFFYAGNEVWLCESVPAKYLTVKDI